MVKPLEQAFPGLSKGGFKVTSAKSLSYNCIAWALNNSNQWWWPLPEANDVFWPAGAPRVETLSAFQAAFASLSYTPCTDDSVEAGFEKIALFADANGLPLHAARQLANGRWTSKLGELEDIDHALHDLEGEFYGKVALLMKCRGTNQPKPIIGLIGGIGSGKTAVAAEFARLGAAVISGDQLGHEALRQPEIRAKVIERFGAEIAKENSDIDRRKLGAIVFGNVSQLRELEKIVFPWIENGLAEQVAAAQHDPAVTLIVVDAAVMLEAGWEKYCDKIIFVDAPKEQRLARLRMQRRWTEKEVEARSVTQMSLKEKSARADATIDNSGLPADSAVQINQLLKRWSFPVAFGAGLLDNKQK